MEIENLKFRSVFKCFHQVFVNLGKSNKQRKLWPIFLKIYVFEKKKKIFFLPLHFRIIF